MPMCRPRGLDEDWKRGLEEGISMSLASEAELASRTCTGLGPTEPIGDCADEIEIRRSCVWSLVAPDGQEDGGEGSGVVDKV